MRMILFASLKMVSFGLLFVFAFVLLDNDFSFQHADFRNIKIAFFGGGVLGLMQFLRSRSKNRSL